MRGCSSSCCSCCSCCDRGKTKSTSSLKPKSEVWQHIDKKIETVIDHIKKADDFKPEEQAEIAVTGSKSSIDEVFGHAKDIEGLEKVLVDHNIKKEFDIKPGAHGYFCEICFGDTHPNFENMSPGLFIFDTTVDNKDPTRNFRNLICTMTKIF